jgi:lipopolysaccharide/colanic/teichoic acid biosynthesis glycosyltransferase
MGVIVGARPRRFRTKRAFDVALTMLAAPLWAAVLAVVAAVIRILDGAPVFFRQRRPGLHGEPFALLKFRTMSEERDESGELLPDADRITPTGAMLRRTSLDELPELLNVLRGEMSLVGPRPLLMEYLDHYSEDQARRHDVPPGITGWAQVNGRNALTWDEKFELDLWYVENHSIALDLRILAMTVGQVVSRRGISAEGHATMPKFGDSK